ncbi:MAG: carbon-nitrogen hydrolase family protein [Chloroflexi bacterium]|nr:MAG: carbon-nitrogen hydrolase family protein [Chloroflexota bacterium]HDN78866.1 carbon-nitrogen hydrolase family protein [Chloroflexota bacterium]
MREVTVALVQMQPKIGEQEENLAKMAEFVKRICLEQKTDLIIFPELVTTGYECGVRFTELAERVPGHTVNFLAQRASEFNVHILFGMPLKEKVESIIYNAAVLIGPDGEVIGDYRKVHLKGEERMAFRPGYRYPVLETGFGLVGIMIGWDLAFPEVARSLTLNGAELLCVLANWEAKAMAEWNTYVMARAYENSIFVAAVNRVGEDYTYSFGGGSIVVGPDGQKRTVIDEPIEGYAVVTLELDEVRQRREETQLLQWRQPETYRAVVRRY